MKLKVTVNQTEYEIDVEVEQEERPQLSPIVIGVNGGSNPIPTKASVSAVSSNAVVAPLAGSVARVLVADGDEIDAGQVRPEGIGNAVDVFTKDNSFDAFFLGHGFQDFLLFHNSSFTRQRRCRRLLVL